MGRVKDLVIDLQNQYGLDFENLPEGFSIDDCIEKKLLDIESSKNEDDSKLLFCQKVKNKNN